MKFLNQFFDAERFFKDKKLLFVGIKQRQEYVNGERSGKTAGYAAEVVISEDNTAYRREAGDTTSNLFEKMTVKLDKAVSIAPNTEVKLVGVTAKVYGNYQNQLSVSADDIIPVTAMKQSATQQTPAHAAQNIPPRTIRKDL